jgi:serine/threonine protein kinase
MDEGGEDDALIGRTIAEKFRIEAFVGRGAMGSVYKARQLALRKTVALKVMRVHGAADRAYGVRFKREASAASRLDHPNSVRVIDFGQEPDGLLYMAMDYVEGRNLYTVLDEDWPLSNERIVSILSQTLAALQVAHAMGVVHRDLKPANILLVQHTDDDGVARELVKVCDFGVAKFLEDDRPKTEGGTAAKGSFPSSHNTTITSHGMTVGTPAYMSPEQALGEAMDARSDLYAVGVILFQMLTRQLPFEAMTPIKMMLKHVHVPPPRPSEFKPDVDSRLEGICMRALSKKPEDRHQSARDMRADLLGEIRQEFVRTLVTREPAKDQPRSSAMDKADKAAPVAKAQVAPTLVLSVLAFLLALCALILALR